MSDDPRTRRLGHQQHLASHASQAPAIAGDLLRVASHQLTLQQVSLLELLLAGALAPLDGFQVRQDAERASCQGRLADGRAWPVPVTLQVAAEFAGARAPGETIALRDPEGVILAALHVSETWQDEDGRWLLGGRVDGLRRPEHHDHLALRRTPTEVRADLATRRWQRTIAYRPGAVFHRGHAAALARLSKKLDAGVLAVAPGGLLSADDVERFGRLRALEIGVREMLDRAILVVIPCDDVADNALDRLLLTAVVARNYGCSHIAVEQDEVSATGLPAARVAERVGELGIEFVAQPGSWWLAARRQFVESSEDAGGTALPCPGGGEVVATLRAGEPLPDWLCSPDQKEALERAFPPRGKRGFTVFFTGLSGSGKSTIANALRVQLLERTGRPVTLLDGDLVRRHLSSELGFSREHRDLNILRIGFVASEITRHGGIAVCCPIAPYDEVRKRVRAMISDHGGFVLVHVATSLEECERRDRKGLYARARAGLIPQFTGISDPYEPPTDAEVTIRTEVTRPDEAVAAVIAHLVQSGYLGDVADVARS